VAIECPIPNSLRFAVLRGQISAAKKDRHKVVDPVGVAPMEHWGRIKAINLLDPMAAPGHRGVDHLLKVLLDHVQFDLAHLFTMLACKSAQGMQTQVKNCSPLSY
jgi:hypothetical protein